MHSGIVSLIETVAKSLADNIQFDYGRTSDFNQKNDKSYPFIHLDPLTSTAGFAVDNTTQYLKTWSCAMAFYQLDREDSTESEYKLILDEMDELVDKFFTKLNHFDFDDATTEGTTVTTEQIIIQAINQQAFIKVTDDILTGWLVNFQIVEPTQIDCTIYE